MHILVLLAAVCVCISNAARVPKRRFEVCGNDKQRLEPKMFPDQFQRLVLQMVQSRDDGTEGLSGCEADRLPQILNNGVIEVQGVRDSCYYCQRTVGHCYEQTNKKRGKSIKPVYFEDTTSVPGYRIIGTNGIPDHCHTDNGTCEFYYAMMLHVFQRPTGIYERMPNGMVGVARSGAFLYNDLRFEAACGFNEQLWDSPAIDRCGGHTWSVDCKYHYHSIPNCMPKWNDCRLVGYLFDGVPIFSLCTLQFASGRVQRMASCYKRSGSGCNFDRDFTFAQAGQCNLDEANGYYFTEAAVSADGEVKFLPGQYAYFYSPEYPFVPPKYNGQKTDYFNDEFMCGIPSTGFYYAQPFSFWENICTRGSFLPKPFWLQEKQNQLGG